MDSKLKLFLPALLIQLCLTSLRPATLHASDSPIHIDDGGNGNPTAVVFIHGNGGSAEQWRTQLSHLRKSRRALAIDLPGFGRSKAPADGDYSLDAMADAIDKAVVAAALDRFVLVGHSYGGAVVAKYAATRPAKVAGVVYLDAAATKLPLDDQQKERISAAVRADKMQVVRPWFAPMLERSTEPVRREVLASVERTPTDAFLGALLSLSAYDARNLISAYEGPAFAIVASDLETPMSFQKQFPDIESVAIAGSGHWLMLDKPDAVDAALDRFLTKIR